MRQRSRVRWVRLLTTTLGLGAVASFAPAVPASTRSVLGDEPRLVRTIELGAIASTGLVYLPDADAFLVLGGAASDIAPGAELLVRSTDERSEPLPSRVATSAPINSAYDVRGSRLLLLPADADGILQLPARSDGVPDAKRPGATGVSVLGLGDPQGMTVDPLAGALFVLDRAGPRILHIAPDARGKLGRGGQRVIDLAASGIDDLRGIALDPRTGHLHVLSPGRQRLYEVTPGGLIVANRDLSGLGLEDPQAIVFAPSGDQTDEPTELSLYVADRDGGDIAELSLAPVTSAVATDVGTLVQTIDASQFDPPSPDSAGIGYVAATDTLLMSDSEVNEMSIFEGKNVFELDASGTLLGSASTLSFSDEPTGVAVDPGSGHIFFSDDTGTDSVHEVDLGPDGTLDTNDDVVNSIATGSFGSNDPEGVGFGNGTLFVADGGNSEVYLVKPGPNDSFGDGDDQVTHFDTAQHGVTDPEGITYDVDHGHLYVVGKPPDVVAHLTTGGALVRNIDISAADAVKPAGLVWAPGSQNPNVRTLWVTQRGVDNNSDPNENDGKIFEFAVPGLAGGNLPPVVSAGPDQSITLPAGASLDGTVSDDGLPDPPGALTTTWSKQSGPGSVSFGDANAVDTSASFSSAGSYVLRLTASDGQLQASDDVEITVAGPGGALPIDVRVAADSDDAEEKESSGSVSLTSSDLELVFDGGSNQVVGMRFRNVGIPNNANVVTAYVQFTVDEATSVDTFLTIQGEDADDAQTFLSTAQNVSNRTPTSASVPWNPVPWNTVGQAGAEQRTPELKTIVQEIVGRSGWQSGNALVILIRGSGERVAESFKGDADAAPLLHVEYTTGPGPTPSATPTPTASATPTPTPSASPTGTPTVPPTPSATPTPTGSATPTASATPTTTPTPQVDCRAQVSQVAVPPAVRLRNSSPDGAQTNGSTSTDRISVDAALVDGPLGFCPVGSSLAVDVRLRVADPQGDVYFDQTQNGVTLVQGSTTRTSFDVTTTPNECPGDQGPPPKDQGGQEIEGTLVFTGSAGASTQVVNGTILCKPSRTTAN